MFAHSFSKAPVIVSVANLTHLIKKQQYILLNYFNSEIVSLLELSIYGVRISSDTTSLRE